MDGWTDRQVGGCICPRAEQHTLRGISSAVETARAQASPHQNMPAPLGNRWGCSTQSMHGEGATSCGCSDPQSWLLQEVVLIYSPVSYQLSTSLLCTCIVCWGVRQAWPSRHPRSREKQALTRLSPSGSVQKGVRSAPGLGLQAGQWVGLGLVTGMGQGWKSPQTMKTKHLALCY